MRPPENGDLVRSCMAMSTAHGLTYIANGKTLLQRLSWLLFFLGACGGFGYFFNKYVTKYYAEPTTVTIQLNSIEYAPPDIYICNLNPLSLSRILEVQRENSSQWQDLLADIQRIEMVLRAINITDDSSGLYFWSSVSRDKLFSVAGYLAQQAVLSLPTVSTFSFNYFSCARYQPADNDTDMRITSSWGTFYLYADGYQLGKDLPVYFGKALSDLNFADPRQPRNPPGMVFYFTPKNTYPFPEVPSRMVGPGQFSIINLRMEKSEACSTSRSRCQKETSQVSYYNPLLGGNATTNYVKTFESCKYSVLLRNMMDDHRGCNCIPPFLSVPLDMALQYPVCANVTEAFLREPRNLTYVQEVANQTLCIIHYLEDALTFNNSDCENENPCSSVRYVPAMSTVRWTEAHLVDTIIEKQLKPLYDDLQVTLPALEAFFEIVKTANDSLKRDLTQNNFAYVSLIAKKV